MTVGCWQVQQPDPVSGRLVCSLIVVLWLVEGVVGVVCGIFQSHACASLYTHGPTAQNQQDAASLVSVI